jgi:hypothetical protein
MMPALKVLRRGLGETAKSAQSPFSREACMNAPDRPFPLPRDLGLPERAPKFTPLVRSVIATARAEFNPDRNAGRVAKELWPGDKATAELVQRAATSFATTADAAWSGPLATYRVQELLTNLGPLSAGSQLLRQGIQLTFDRNFEIRVPGITVSASYAGFVGEGKPIPVRQLPVSAGAILEPRKFATIVTLTREMVVSSNAEELVRAVLVDAVAAALDVALFSTTAGDANRPPGLLYNVDGLTPTAASTPPNPVAAMMTDLGALAALVAPFGGLDICYITDPATAVRLTFAMGAQFKIPVIASGGVTPKTVICLALPALCSATDPAPRLEAGRDWAAMHFEDTSPQDITGGSPSPAVPVRSLFQADSVGVRLTMFVSWALRAAGSKSSGSGSIAFTPGVTW